MDVTSGLSADLGGSAASAIAQWDSLSGSGPEPSLVFLVKNDRFALPKRFKTNYHTKLDRRIVMDSHFNQDESRAVYSPPPERPKSSLCWLHDLTLQAIARGQGVSLAYDMMVRGTLTSGRLLRLFDAVTMPVVIYSLAYPEARKNDPLIKEFESWIFGEMAKEEPSLAAE